MTSVSHRITSKGAGDSSSSAYRWSGTAALCASLFAGGGVAWIAVRGYGERRSGQLRSPPLTFILSPVNPHMGSIAPACIGSPKSTSLEVFLATPELILHVLEDIPSGSALSRLARVCKTWSPLVIDVKWRTTLIHLKRLFDILG